MKILIFTSLLIIAQASFAQIDRKGNGGDMCENRFEVVRDDIKTWILNGGSAGLSLPSGISYSQYNQAMLQQIQKAKISCTDEQIFVGNAEKTCKNFVAADGSVLINCNTGRFMNTSDSDQYVLVHHEYAGLAGYEVNQGEASDYQISNQLTGFLENQVVKKLVVKPPVTSEDPFTQNACQGEPITLSEVGQMFPPGGTVVTLSTVFHQHDRKCNGVSGCSDWGQPEVSQPITVEVTISGDSAYLWVHDKDQFGNASNQMYCHNVGLPTFQCDSYWYRGTGYNGDSDHMLFQTYYAKFTKNCLQIIGRDSGPDSAPIMVSQTAALVRF